jgi:hypothetical protein
MYVHAMVSPTCSEGACRRIRNIAFRLAAVLVSRPWRDCLSLLARDTPQYIFAQSAGAPDNAKTDTVRCERDLRPERVQVSMTGKKTQQKQKEKPPQTSKEGHSTVTAPCMASSADRQTSPQMGSETLACPHDLLARYCHATTTGCSGGNCECYGIGFIIGDEETGWEAYLQLTQWLSGCNGPSPGNAWWCYAQRILQQSAGSRPAPPGDLVLC